jgi:hypothetical protein
MEIHFHNALELLGLLGRKMRKRRQNSRVIYKNIGLVVVFRNKSEQIFAVIVICYVANERNETFADRVGGVSQPFFISRKTDDGATLFFAENRRDHAPDARRSAADDGKSSVKSVLTHRRPDIR